MPLIFIKNNLKLMLRSKWIFVLMILLPLLTMGLLSNAFSQKMNAAYKMEAFTIGYRLENGSKYEGMIRSLQESCKEKKILLHSYPQGDIDEILKNEKVATFVEVFENGTYRMYQVDNKKPQAMIAQSIFSAIFYQVNEELTAQTYVRKVQTKEALVSYGVKSIQLAVDPVPSALDYYGIIYLVYFAWCGMVSLMAVISSERKSAVLQRIKVAQISKVESYMAKWVPCTLATIINVCITWGLSVAIYSIHWGNIGLSFGIIILVSMAASAFGLVLFQLFRNVAISIVFGFIIIWIFGYFGGSFEAYMYLTIPDYLMKASPIYYINHALIDYSIKGSSDYTGVCFTILTAMIIVCGIVGTLLIDRKMEA